MMISREEIFRLVDRIIPEITAIRHHIHQYPELAGDEYQTSALVRKIMQRTAASVLPPFLQTDVVALLNGATPGRNVTLRADMDALPLQELNELSYKSTIPGLMHACGHDAHTSMLLGAALVLDQLRGHFAGSVRFVFQPGEEVAALGRKLVAAGALLNPEPAAVFAIHDISGYDVGSIISRPGPMMAAAGFFKITVIGKGGHGSRPEMAIDPILTGCRIVEGLQSIISRQLNPQTAAVISVCRFEGGKNANVIPESVEIEGTIRFLDATVGEQLPGMIETIIKGICLAAGAQYRFDYSLPYLPTLNDPACVRQAREVTEKMFGKEMWHEMERASMGAEDFCYYLDKYPGVLCDLGIGCDCPPIHSPHFNFNDQALRNGIAFLVAIALDTLKD